MMKIKKLTVFLAVCCTLALVFGISFIKPVNAETEQGKSPITGVYMTLSDSLIVKFKVELNETADENSLSGKFTFNGEDKVVTEYEEKGGVKVFAYDGITPQHMNDELTFVLSYKADGVQKDYSEKFTVLGYLQELYATKKQTFGYTNAKYDALRTLLGDMLEYGATSQTYVEEDTGNLVNKGLDWAGTDFSTLSPESCLTAAEHANTEALTWQYAKLNLSYNVSVVVGFSLKNKENIGTLTAKVEKDGITSEAIGVKQVEGGYEIVYNEVGVSEFDKALTFTVYEDGIKVGNSVAYSVASYVKRITAGSSATENMKALAKAVYSYGHSATVFDKEEVYEGAMYEMAPAANYSYIGGSFPADASSPEIEFLAAHDYLGDNEKGKTRTFYFYSEETQTVQADIIVANGLTPANPLGNIVTSFKINDVEYNSKVNGLTDDNPDSISWTYFGSVSCEVPLKKGNNTLSLTVKGGNFSGIRLKTQKEVATITDDYVGARTFECEDNVKITGFQDHRLENRMVTSTDVANIGAKNQGTTGQTLTWYISASKDCEVDGVIRVGNGQSLIFVPAEKLPMTIYDETGTGKAVTYSTPSVTTSNEWVDYKDILFTANLTKGVNRVFVAVNIPSNFDSFTLTPKDEMVFLKSLKPYENEIIMECECYKTINYKYQIKNNTQYDTGGRDGKATLDGEIYSTSNGYNLGWFNEKGRTATYGFFANKKGTVTMKLRLAVGDCADAVDLKDFINVTLCGKEQSIQSKVFTSNGWHAYTDVTVTLEVKEGLNDIAIILMSSVGGANLDCFTLTGVDGVQVCENWQYR